MQKYDVKKKYKEKEQGYTFLKGTLSTVLQGEAVVTQSSHVEQGNKAALPHPRGHHQILRRRS